MVTLQRTNEFGAVRVGPVMGVWWSNPAYDESTPERRQFFAQLGPARAGVAEARMTLAFLRDRTTDTVLREAITRELLSMERSDGSAARRVPWGIIAGIGTVLAVGAGAYFLAR